MTQTFVVPPAGPALSMPTNRDVVLGFLNAALATELHALVRCKRHYYSSDLSGAEDLREDYLEQAIEESMLTDRIVQRIVELGGHPDFSAQQLADISPVEPAKRGDVRQLIKEDVEAQRVAIESYRNIVRMIGPSDVATCAVLEDIIRADQHFVERLARHLDSPKPGTVGHS